MPDGCCGLGSILLRCRKVQPSLLINILFGNSPFYFTPHFIFFATSVYTKRVIDYKPYFVLRLIMLLFTKKKKSYSETQTPVRQQLQLLFMKSDYFIHHFTQQSAVKGLCEKFFMLGAQRKCNCSIISKFPRKRADDLAESEGSSFSNAVSVYRTKTDIFRYFPTKTADV